MPEAKAFVIIPKSDKKATEIVLDMYPLVLCKDCKHSMSYENGFYGCGKGHGLQLGDWFCADGEEEGDL